MRQFTLCQKDLYEHMDMEERYKQYADKVKCLEKKPCLRAPAIVWGKYENMENRTVIVLISVGYIDRDTKLHINHKWLCLYKLELGKSKGILKDSFSLAKQIGYPQILLNWEGMCWKDKTKDELLLV